MNDTESLTCVPTHGIHRSPFPGHPQCGGAVTSWTTFTSCSLTTGGVDECPDRQRRHTSLASSLSFGWTSTYATWFSRLPDDLQTLCEHAVVATLKQCGAGGGPRRTHPRYGCSSCCNRTRARLAVNSVGLAAPPLLHRPPQVVDVDRLPLLGCGCAGAGTGRTAAGAALLNASTAGAVAEASDGALLLTEAGEAARVPVVTHAHSARQRGTTATLRRCPSRSSPRGRAGTAVTIRSA